MGSNVIVASEKEETSRESASSAWRQNRFAPSIGELTAGPAPGVSVPRTSPMWRVTNRVPIAFIARPDDPILSFELPMAMTGLGQGEKNSRRA